MAPALLTRMSRRPSSAIGAFDQPANGLFVAHVGGNGEGAPSESADGAGGLMDAAGQPFGGLLALGGHRDVRPFLGQPDGQRLADAAARAGDHRHAAAQVGMQRRIGFGHTLH